ncbi:MAG: NAD(P)H nitroreductase [Peptococcaceae bacterium]|jgi:nitroreductase|nr:NAD(P)H nitroreductase [Peptococcaceae bacterium]
MLDLLYQRRSIRRYLPTPIEEEKVQTLTKAALLAPSGRGVESQKFIVVNDKNLVTKLAQTREFGSAFLQDAPLVFVVLGDSNATDVWVEDAALAATIIQLTAHSLGLGSCWVQIRNRQHNTEKTAEEYVQELLNIPKHLKVACMLGIGYPAEKKEARTDNDLDFSRVHTNTHKI